MILLFSKKSNFLRELTINHLIIMGLFLLLTFVFTFPWMLNFDNIFGHIVDPSYPIWQAWWFNYALTDIGSNPLQSDYVLYPVGINPTTFTLYNSILSVILQQFTNVFVSYNILLISTFVLAGYFNFHLTKYITKNYFVSIIAGIIFSFSAFHVAQSINHLSPATIQWIPLVFLFLLKSQYTNKKRYLVLLGISLLLVFYLRLDFRFFYRIQLNFVMLSLVNF